MNESETPLVEAVEIPPVVAEPIEGSTAADEAPEYFLVARNPVELEQAHHAMLKWARDKQADMLRQVHEAQERISVAKRSKWSTTKHVSDKAMAHKRLSFYQKIEGAIMAGYLVIPDLPLNLFAVRTKATRPKANRREGAWNTGRTLEGQQLPAGEGTYVSAEPTVRRFSVNDRNDKGALVERWFNEAAEFREVSFPVVLAKPVLMTQVAQAMTLKVFDEIGLVVDGNMSGMVNRGTRGKGDPILVGRIRNPRQFRPSACFFLGWGLQTDRL